jgi:hypothetical protein
MFQNLFLRKFSLHKFKFFLKRLREQTSKVLKTKISCLEIDSSLRCPLILYHSLLNSQRFHFSLNSTARETFRCHQQDRLLQA